ncbi:MAG: alginate export family protein [Panacagrimonas sp.]
MKTAEQMNWNLEAHRGLRVDAAKGNPHKDRLRAFGRWRVNAFAAVLAVSLGGGVFPAPAADSGSPAAAPAETPPPKPKAVESRGYGTRAESEPPRYVRHAGTLGLATESDLDWLLLGADFRVRYEDRNNDYRRSTMSDDPFLLRTRIYLGIEKILDPVRFGLELQDARMVHSQVPDNVRDVNKSEVLQAYVELYGKDVFGLEQPLRLQAGRLAFEYLDRRLISRNPWRNTTNNFEGFRLLSGSHQGMWWLDLLAVQPVEILPDESDRGDEQRWFYGAIGSWGKWSSIATLQPYVLLLDEDRTGNAKREIYTWGLRSFAVFKSGFDYDVDLALQTGQQGAGDHQAWAGAAELGYTFPSAWTPRTSGSIGYASGDRDPTDNENNRFNRLFGFGRPWSANDYQIWENIIAPKARIELKPSNEVQLEAGYGAFWLASDKDSWSPANRRDSSGDSGSFIGHEVDTRVRWRLDPRVEFIGGYTHFFPGGFTEKTGPSPDSDFVYLELSLQALK